MYTETFSKSHSRTARFNHKSKGYFLFELVISALMIAAIAVLAFPTYQDFSPEYEATGESAGIIQGDQDQGSPAASEPDSVFADQPNDLQETRSDSEQENTPPVAIKS